MKLRPVIADELITVAEAAVLAGRSAGWVREQAACGRIEAVRGDQLMVSREDIAWLAQQRRSKPRLPVPYLRLVIDNTKK